MCASCTVAVRGLLSGVSGWRLVLLCKYETLRYDMPEAVERRAALAGASEANFSFPIRSHRLGPSRRPPHRHGSAAAALAAASARLAPAHAAAASAPATKKAAPSAMSSALPRPKVSTLTHAVFGPVTPVVPEGAPGRATVTFG